MHWRYCSLAPSHQSLFVLPIIHLHLDVTVTFQWLQRATWASCSEASSIYGNQPWLWHRLWRSQALQVHECTSVGTAKKITIISLMIHHDMETFSTYCLLLSGIHWSPVDSLWKGPVKWSFDNFNKLLYKQLNCQWFDMPWHLGDITVVSMGNCECQVHVVPLVDQNQGPVSISDKTSYCKTLWNLEAARFVI